MYHGIFFTECTSQNWLGRGYGVHRLANEIRKYGFNILVIDWAFAVDFDLYKEILDLAVGPETMFVGFSTSIFPYRMQDVEGQKKASLLQHSYARESADDFLKLEREEKKQNSNEIPWLALHKSRLGGWIHCFLFEVQYGKTAGQKPKVKKYSPAALGIST